MKSLGDPILDMRAVCREKPLTKDEIQAEYKALGWGVPFEDVFRAANGIFIKAGDDGRYRAIG
jgi:hypothetical protein